MKIHRYGNDYAYQQKQKSQEIKKAQVKEEKPAVPVQETPKEAEDAGNRICEEGRQEGMAETEETGGQVLGQTETKEEEVHPEETEKAGSERAGDKEAGEDTQEKPHKKKKLQ